MFTRLVWRQGHSDDRLRRLRAKIGDDGRHHYRPGAEDGGHGADGGRITPVLLQGNALGVPNAIDNRKRVRVHFSREQVEYGGLAFRRSCSTSPLGIALVQSMSGRHLIARS